MRWMWSRRARWPLCGHDLQLISQQFRWNSPKTSPFKPFTPYLPGAWYAPRVRRRTRADPLASLLDPDRTQIRLGQLETVWKLTELNMLHATARFGRVRRHATVKKSVGAK